MAIFLAIGKREDREWILHVFKYKQDGTMLQPNDEKTPSVPDCSRWERDPLQCCSTFSVLLGPITEESDKQREGRSWGGGFKHTVFSLYELMRCLVYNVLYRTAIQGYRVSYILPKFCGEKKIYKRRVVLFLLCRWW